MLLELAPQEIGICGLAAETIPVLCQHHEDAATSHEVPHTVHARPLQARSALAGVLYLLEHLVAFSGSIVSQGFDLLGERVAGAGLLVCGDAGVEDSPLWAVAVRVRHGQSPMSSAGSTPSARANFRRVLM